MSTNIFLYHILFLYNKKNDLASIAWGIEMLKSYKKTQVQK
jgi:hypothetical protein